MAARTFFALLTLLTLAGRPLAQQQPRRPNPPPNPMFFGDCSRCSAEACPPSAQVCRSGLVKDGCDCCTVCGKNQGEPCDMDVVGDRTGAYRQPAYSPTLGRCGDNLQCVWHKDETENRATDYAVCECKYQDPVCGEDGKTYKNKCDFDETMAGRAERFRIARDEPCDQAPKIMTSSKSLEERIGADLVLSCEVSGYPTPKIEWKFTQPDTQKTITLPSDHTSKSVQVRGGPDHYQVTSWLQISNLQPQDAGLYSCWAKNKLGKATADTSLSVVTGREL